MEVISQVSAHAGQNRELYLSAYGPLPGTLQYYLSQKSVLVTTSMHVIV